MQGHMRSFAKIVEYGQVIAQIKAFDMSFSGKRTLKLSFRLNKFGTS